MFPSDGHLTKRKGHWKNIAKLSKCQDFKSLASSMRRVIYCCYQEKQSQTFYIYLPLYYKHMALERVKLDKQDAVFKGSDCMTLILML